MFDEVGGRPLKKIDRPLRVYEIAPAAIQTRSMPPKLGTARDTSDGCTKIDEPTIVPTTIAVACVNPIVRANLAVTPRIVSSAAPKIGS